jgi:hypothetical protein
MSRHWLAVCSLVFLVPLEALAQDPVQEVRECMERNVPKKSSVENVRIVRVDRIGGESSCRGRVFAAQLANGRRSSRVCLHEPPPMRGTEYLSTEVPGGALESWLYLPEARSPRQLTGAAIGGGVCGSDVSYEDLERMQQLNRSESLDRRPDAKVDGREVYVIQAKPLDSTQSAYTKVLSYVDRKSCVVIKSESFASGDSPRKRMTVRADDMLESNGVVAPAEVLVEDLRDKTHTTVSFDDLKVDEKIDERSFSKGEMGRHCR